MSIVTEIIIAVIVLIAFAICMLWAGFDTIDHWLCVRSMERTRIELRKNWWKFWKWSKIANESDEPWHFSRN